MMAEKIEGCGNKRKMMGNEDTMQVWRKRKSRSEEPLLPSPSIHLFFSTSPSHHILCSGSHSILLCPTPLLFTPLLPLLHPPPFPASAPHPISALPLNKSWRDNSTIVAHVWEPWTETIAVYPSSGTAWTLFFITAGQVWLSLFCKCYNKPLSQPPWLITLLCLLALPPSLSPTLPPLSFLYIQLYLDFLTLYVLAPASSCYDCCPLIYILFITSDQENHIYQRRSEVNTQRKKK